MRYSPSQDAGPRRRCCMKLYATPLSHFSRKIRILLAELGIPFEWVRTPGVMDAVPADYGDNPLMRIPTLVDGDHTLIESDHVARYIVAKHDPRDWFGVTSVEVAALNRLAVANRVMATAVTLLLAKRGGVDPRGRSVGIVAGVAPRGGRRHRSAAARRRGHRGRPLRRVPHARTVVVEPGGAHARAARCGLRRTRSIHGVGARRPDPSLHQHRERHDSREQLDPHVLADDQAGLRAAGRLVRRYALGPRALRAHERRSHADDHRRCRAPARVACAREVITHRRTPGGRAGGAA